MELSTVNNASQRKGKLKVGYCCYLCVIKCVENINKAMFSKSIWYDCILYLMVDNINIYRYRRE